MILKIKNINLNSWRWIDDVIECACIPCEIKSNPEYKKGEGSEYIIESQSSGSVFEVDRFFKWPLKIGDCANILIIQKGKGTNETMETAIVEYDGVFILGSEGKTLDRI